MIYESHMDRDHKAILKPHSHYIEVVIHGRYFAQVYLKFVATFET